MITDPIPVIIYCPLCGLQHIDGPEIETGWNNPPHKAHLCRPQDGGCGNTWQPYHLNTVGVKELSDKAKYTYVGSGLYLFTDFNYGEWERKNGATDDRD